MTEAAHWQQLAWLTGAVVLGLALLYLLRPRRRQVEVPFGGLWQRVIAKAQARALSTRWRRFWSWLFNVVIALLLIAAIGDGVIGIRGCSRQVEVDASHTVLLIDTSASMQAMDGLDTEDAALGAPISRLTEAIQRATKVLETAVENERFLLITANARVRVRTGWTSQTEVVSEALERVVATDAGLDSNAAFGAARDALSGRAPGRIVVVTDGGTPLGGTPWQTSAQIQYIAVGPTTKPNSRAESGIPNLAIEQVSARRLPTDPGHGALWVRVRNDGDEAVRGIVTIASSSTAQTPAEFRSNAALKGSQVVELPPRSTRPVVFDRVVLSAGRFAAMIRPAEAAQTRDLAPYDDMGFAVLASKRQLHGVLVTAGNLFLQAALLADDRIQLDVVTPADYEPDRYAAAGKAKHGVDFVVLDQANKLPPEGTPSLVFQLANADPTAGGTILDAVDMVVRKEDHPTMNGLSFADVNIDRGRPLQLASGDVAVAGDRGGAALIVANDRGVRRLTVGLDLLQTDIGGRFALPLLVGNAVDWLMGEDNPLVSPLQVGDVWGVEVPAGGRKWQWTAPGAKPTPARVAGNLITASSAVSGIHLWHSGELSIARPTFVPPTERPSAKSALPTTWKAPPESVQRRNRPPPRTAWLDLLLIALVALVLEWSLYQRRRTV